MRVDREGAGWHMPHVITTLALFLNMYIFQRFTEIGLATGNQFPSPDQGNFSHFNMILGQARRGGGY